MIYVKCLSNEPCFDLAILILGIFFPKEIIIYRQKSIDKQLHYIIHAAEILEPH